MKKLIGNIILPLLVVTPINAFASYPCTGVLDKVTVSKAGYVQVSSTQMYGGTDGRSVCTIDAEWKDVSASACKAWLATLLTAKATGAEVLIQYLDDGFTCATHPAWSSSNSPHAVQLRN